MDQRRKVRSPRLKTTCLKTRGRKGSKESPKRALPRYHGTNAQIGGRDEATELPTLLLDDLIPPQDVVPDTLDEHPDTLDEHPELVTNAITRIISGFISPITIVAHPRREDFKRNMACTRSTDDIPTDAVATVTVESPGGITYHLPIDISQKNWERRLTRSLTDITGYCSS